MRILQVTNTFVPVRNGVTISVEGWSRGLRALGHDVGVWTITSPGAAACPTDAYCVEGFGRLAEGFALPRTLRPPDGVALRGWDVVHLHHPVLLGTAASRFARATGAAVAATVHSDYVAYVDSYAPLVAGLGRPLVRAIMRRFFEAADLVFAPSGHVESALDSWGVSTPTMRSTYPVDVSRLAPRPRAEARAVLGLSPDRPIALYAGRLAVEKRVSSLIDEFAVTLAALPSACLMIVGGGPLENSLRRQADAYDGRVLVRGEVDHTELGVWYAAADVLVSASLNEVGPLSAIEAGLCSTASVAPSSTGFCDRIVDGVTGRLAAPEPGALGQVMAEVLCAPPIAHRMGRAAAWAYAEHSVLRSAQLLADAYARAIELNECRARDGRRCGAVLGADLGRR